MANLKLQSSSTLKATICIFLLAIFLGCAEAARMLDEADPQAPLPAGQPNVPNPIDEADTPVAAPLVDPATTLPSGQIPTTDATAPVVDPSVPLPATPVIAPSTVGGPVNTPAMPVSNTAPVATLSSGPGGSAIAATGANGEHPTLSFFMHDILGGTHPSGRVVTGIVANSDANNLPFSKPNTQVFPINGGLPINNVNGIVNNNNYPFLAGLNGNNPSSSTILQNNGNNNVVNSGNNLPFVTAGQLPAGITLQQLMFGSITVFDNELTEGHELGTSVLGRGQGFYLASSLDGSSHTFALTTLLHGTDHEVDDTISFFGVHRTATPISEIAVIGGTGKYENAKGYATIETLPQVDQHTTDGVDTIVQVNVYLTAAP